MTEHERVLGSLLPASVAVSAGPIEDVGDSPFAEEREVVASAIAKRRMEFFCGRHHARCALRKIGAPGRAISRNLDRSPVWPKGVTGSIAHSDRSCVAVAAFQSDHASLGVDVESAAPLEDALIDTVLGAGEKMAATTIGSRSGIFAKIIFSAKEAVFKALYPIDGVFLDFGDITIDLDERRQKFSANVSRPFNSPAYKDASFSGSFCFVGGDIVTFILLPPAPSG